MAKKRSVGKAAPPEVETPYQVFVSHATADKWLARMICEKIEGVRAKTFRDDRDIDGGDDIPESIRRQIKRSREVVVILSPESINRPWVLLEIGAAWGIRRETRITPILCHVSFDTIPDMLKNKKALSLNDFDHYLGELERRVRGRHGRT